MIFAAIFIKIMIMWVEAEQSSKLGWNEPRLRFEGSSKNLGSNSVKYIFILLELRLNQQPCNRLGYFRSLQYKARSLEKEARARFELKNGLASTLLETILAAAAAFFLLRKFVLVYFPWEVFESFWQTTNKKGFYGLAKIPQRATSGVFGLVPMAAEVS